MFVPRYSQQEAREAVSGSLSYAEALRKLGLRPGGGNHALFRRYVDAVWRIPTDHFDPGRAQREGLCRRPVPLFEVLVAGSSYSRATLKIRLYECGLKARRCELCAQDENWRGARMGLILDHINGVPDDNRLENLRIVCPNCAATFDTHCARKNRVDRAERACLRCGTKFWPKRLTHRYCSRACGMRYERSREPKPEARKVERPSYEQLQEDVRTMSMLAVGRKYGVSDSAVRKWIRWYERGSEGKGETEAA
jgi:hypothetical protein